MKMLITDLDNTLYDWATYFSKSFRAMAEDLADLLEMDIETILDQFKEVHERYGNTEQPFAILELPCVKIYYGSISREKLAEKLDRPLHKFNSTRKQTLFLYKGVEETLALLFKNGIKIIAVTEAMPENAYYRLLRLNIIKYFNHIYSVEGDYLGHPNEKRDRELSYPRNIIKIILKENRKPNPDLLVDICRMEEINIKEACYIGDSLTKDIRMANEAGIQSIWARYGTKVDPVHWNRLVRITHWKEEDVKREKRLSSEGGIKPDHVIDCFSEITSIMSI